MWIEVLLTDVGDTIIGVFILYAMYRIQIVVVEDLGNKLFYLI
jgi:hypothetical protein